MIIINFLSAICMLFLVGLHLFAFFCAVLQIYFLISEPENEEFYSASIILLFTICLLVGSIVGNWIKKKYIWIIPFVRMMCANIFILIIPEIMLYYGLSHGNVSSFRYYAVVIFTLIFILFERLVMCGVYDDEPVCYVPGKNKLPDDNDTTSNYKAKSKEIDKTKNNSSQKSIANYDSKYSEERFMAWMEENNLSKTTINSYLSGLRFCAKYALEKGYATEDLYNSIDSLEKIYKKLLNDSNFMDANEKAHGVYTSAFKKFIAFCSSESSD